MIKWFEKKYEWFMKADSETKVSVVFSFVAIVIVLLMLTSCGSPSVAV